MRVSICSGILAGLFAITTATYQLGYPYAPTPYISGYPHDLYHHQGANVYNPFVYSASQLQGVPSYDFYPGHSSHFRGFAYHNDFNGGSTSNVLFLTGPSASPLGHFSGLYPTLEQSPAIEIARKKASDSLDKNKLDTTKKVAATGKIPQSNVVTKDLCDTIQDAFGRPGLHNFYSFDNSPFFPQYDLLPTAAPWPNLNQFLTPIDKNGPGTVQVNLPEDGGAKQDDDTVSIERKVTVPSSSDTPTSVLNSDDTPKTSEDSTPGPDEDETRTIPPLTPSSEPPSSESAETTTVESGRKRKSLRVRVAKKL